MPVLYALIGSVVVWLVVWSLGFKAFDGFMLVLLLLILPATAWMIAAPFVRKQLGRE